MGGGTTPSPFRPTYSRNIAPHCIRIKTKLFVMSSQPLQQAYDTIRTELKIIIKKHLVKKRDGRDRPERLSLSITHKTSPTNEWYHNDNKAPASELIICLTPRYPIPEQHDSQRQRTMYPTVKSYNSKYCTPYFQITKRRVKTH